MNDLAALADTVRTARRRKRWGQKDLAREAGVSLGVISNLERQLTRPQPTNERQILHALGVETPEDEEHFEEERREWSRDVAVALDVLGLYLMGTPEPERADAIHDLVRHAMSRASR